MALFNKQDRRSLPQHPIFKESIEAFAQELANFFPEGDLVPTFSVKQDEDLKDVRDQYKSEKFSLPLFTYMLDTLSPNTERANNGFLSRNGIIIDKIPNRTDTRLENPWLSYSVLYLTPADLAINVYYYASYDQQYTFAPMWQQAAKNHYLDFAITVGERDLTFKVDINPDVTFTPVNLDDGTYIKFTTSVVLHTCHGVIGKVKPATSSRINTGIIDHGDIPDKKVHPSTEITLEKGRTFKVVNKSEED